MSYPPYVGITGYTEPEQALAVHKATAHLTNRHVLMDGYLLRAHDVSDRWAIDDKHPSHFADRFIELDKARSVFSTSSSGPLRLVHFCTTVERGLDEQLQACMDALGQGVDGFQVNWIDEPDAHELADFKRDQDATRAALDLAPLVIVLQLHNVVTNNSATLGSLLDFVRRYIELAAITHVLFDPSAGQGREYEPDRAASFISLFTKEFSETNIAVAGGLAPENVSKQVRPLWDADPNVSIDAEGRLRDPATDALNVKRAIAYATRALELSQEFPVAP